jgi:hypothetical protein
MARISVVVDLQQLRDLLGNHGDPFPYPATFYKLNTDILPELAVALEAAVVQSLQLDAGERVSVGAEFIHFGHQTPLMHVTLKAFVGEFGSNTKASVDAIQEVMRQLFRQRKWIADNLISVAHI